MKRDEFLLGACIYALVILSHFSAPILNKLQQSDWDKPVASLIRAYFHTPDRAALRRARGQGLPAVIRPNNPPLHPWSDGRNPERV